MTLSRLPSNTLTLLGSNLGGALLLFVLSALIGRTFGSPGLGVYAVALAWVYPLSLVVEFGLTTLMTRAISADSTQIPAYMESITVARLLLGGGVLITFYLAAPLISRDPVVITALQISAPLIVIQPFYSQFTTVFKAQGRLWTIPALNLGMIGAQVVLTTIALAYGGNVLHALSLNTVTSAGQLVAAWWLYQRLTLAEQARLLLSLGRGGWGVRLVTLLRAAFPFALAAIFAALQVRMVFLLLEQQVIEAGYFSAANRFIEAAKLLPNAFFAALFPLIGSATVQSAFRPAALGLAAFGLVAGIGFTVAAPLLLTLVFGGGFQPAVPTLIVLGWSLLFFALRGARTIYWYAHSGEHFVNGVNAFAVVAIFVLSAALIPAYGAVGGAVAVLLTDLGVTTVLYIRNA
ncbi:MAG: oligosaccharide flippase family protein [Chloroflexi bacterium]|uniref:oligosaccharide flippase family protein n=1 Tax=Candidatus Flexifilum breve TaxID=3140694 RepID=UPI003134C82D|nr:oligosaccharide flippase family protein [Chloroflexota bacterium]